MAGKEGNQAFNASIDKVRERVGNRPQESSQFVDAEIQKWGAAVKESGAHMD